MDTQTLKETMIREIKDYARRGYQTQGFFMQSPDETMFTVVFIGKIRDQRTANTAIIARLVGDRVVIDRDQTDKMLVDALLQAGVPREQIVLAYAGESIPEMDAIWQRT